MRTRSQTKDTISKEHYGLKDDSGQWVQERYINTEDAEREKHRKKNDLYLCFTDCEKTFDSVKHDDLFECLKKAGVGGKDRKIMADLYWKQETAIKLTEILLNG